MKLIHYVLCLVVLFLGACAARAETPPAPESASNQPSSGASTGLALTNFRGELFSAHGSCTICHTNMRDESGADVSTDRLWASSMMANAARDPYWQASVRHETLEFPQYQVEIEDKCATCHTPMARFSDQVAGTPGRLLDEGYLNAAHAIHPLAVDGVSCNLCHQVQAGNLGQEDSFSGGFQIDAQRPMGERLSYGPYTVSQGNATIMANASGFVPEQGLHIQQAELCATCHTLYTPYVDQQGEIAGEFPEQTIYLEWLHSGRAESGPACQGCHMPPAQGGVQLSITGGPQRSPFNQHQFVGGNAFMGSIFEKFGEELGAVASSQQFSDTVALARQQLQEHTARLVLEGVRLEGDTLVGEVVIQTETGHKFPSGFPARRAWLHLVVEDGTGKVVFESGAFEQDGAIQGNDHDRDPALFEPHYTWITSAEQVQIYEDILGDAMGEVTTTLLRGMGYLKDNRLLPPGFDKDSAPADIAVYGAALADEDFQAGGDRLAFELDMAGAPGPFTLRVELLYQSIGYRWAENLRQSGSEEAARFWGFYEQIPNQPWRVAEARVEVGR